MVNKMNTQNGLKELKLDSICSVREDTVRLPMTPRPGSRPFCSSENDHISPNDESHGQPMTRLNLKLTILAKITGSTLVSGYSKAFR